MNRWIYNLFCLILALSGFGANALAQTKQFTVVIDPGHGGKDAGAVSFGYKEKDIVLAVAKKLGKRIKSNYPSVRVLYTRERDVFIGLQARADFANRNKASLFISIHANSTASNNSVSGTETYVLGPSKQDNNLSVAMRENEVILLEKDYKTTYQGFEPNRPESYIMFELMQEAYIARSVDMANYVEKQYKRTGRPSRGVRQQALWVLSQSAMPSVLTEVGFISNKREAQYMASEAGQNEIAGALSKAFTQFYEGRSKQVKVPKTTETKDDTDETTEADASDSPESISQSEQYQSEVQTKGSGRSTSLRAKDKPKSVATKQATTVNSRYKVQFMSSRDKFETKDAQFKRLKQTVSRDRMGSYWIYTIGNTRSLAEAKALQQSIRKLYPDSFVVEYQGSKRIGRVR